MIRFLSLIFVTLGFAGPTQALVSMPASGCIPNLPTIRDDRALVGNAFVRHAGDNTDPIVLTCAVPRFEAGMFANWLIRITYRDSNGQTANAFVRAQLYRMALGHANPDLLAVANSNTETATGLNEASSAVFNETFNFSTYTYWFHIELDRASPNQTVILQSIALVPVVFSDVRAKHSIALLGHLANGLGFYRFSYHGSDKAYVGVMAQEVEAIRPDAVIRGSDGYLRVFYDKLGLRIQSWEDWVAAGANIPATTNQSQP